MLWFLKCFAFPLMVLCKLFSLLLRAAVYLSSYLLGPFLLFLLGCGISTLLRRTWDQTLILAVVAAGCIGLYFGVILLICLVDDCSERLANFIRGGVTDGSGLYE